jgi:hypothetical protein
LAAVATSEMMLLLLLMLLRLVDFCHIYNIWQMLRCGEPPPLPTSATFAGSFADSPQAGEGEIQEAHSYDIRYGKRTGYHLEEHLVTLWRGWR